jgi:hypothetical protein
MHDDTGALLHVRHYRLGQPQRGSQVDVDHEPQRLWSRAERVPGDERADGVHQHRRRPNFGSDPVDELGRHSGVCGLGHLAADTAGEVKQSSLVPVDRHH